MKVQGHDGVSDRLKHEFYELQARASTYGEGGGSDEEATKRNGKKLVNCRMP